MNQAMFPASFMWGTATAAYQVEGNNRYSDFWAEEHAEGSPYRDKSGTAIDHYHLYREDIQLMAGLGLNTYRFSIEWARIEPERGQFSREATEHYRDMLQACHEYGLTPLVTLHHFSSPQWLMKLGGWASVEVVACFAAYTEWIMRELGDLIPYVMTFNEVNLPIMLREVFSNIGVIPPVGIDAAAWSAPAWRESAARLCGTTVERYFTFHMISDERSIDLLKQTHRRARAIIRQLRPETKVGFSMALSDVQYIPGGEAIAEQKWAAYFRTYADLAEGDDYFGLQNYTREVYGSDGLVAPEEDAELTQMKYEFYPEALEKVIRRVADELKLPIIITEHGVATEDDTRRVEYIRRGLQGVQSCLADGIDVRGYMYWSAFDNFEWNSGYAMTFGMIGVDRSTQERTVKASGHYLGQIARSHNMRTPESAR